VPGAGDVADVGALAEFALLADHAADPFQLGSEALVDFDHLVEGVGDLAVEPHQVVRHPVAQVAALEGQQAVEQETRGIRLQRRFGVHRKPRTRTRPVTLETTACRPGRGPAKTGGRTRTTAQR